MRILELEPQGDWQGVCILSGGSIRSQDSLNCHVALTFPPAGFLGVALQYVLMAGKGLSRVAIFLLKLNFVWMYFL